VVLTKLRRGLLVSFKATVNSWLQTAGSSFALFESLLLRSLLSLPFFGLLSEMCFLSLWKLVFLVSLPSAVPLSETDLFTMFRSAPPPVAPGVWAPTLSSLFPDSGPSLAALFSSPLREVGEAFFLPACQLPFNVFPFFCLYRSGNGHLYAPSSVPICPHHPRYRPSSRLHSMSLFFSTVSPSFPTRYRPPFTISPGKHSLLDVYCRSPRSKTLLPLNFARPWSP